MDAIRAIGAGGCTTVGTDNTGSAGAVAPGRRNSTSSGTRTSSALRRPARGCDQQALTAGGNLVLSAGNDVNLVAAKLDAGKGLGISAGNDINASTLTTVDTSNTLETRKRFKQTTATRDETVYGTEFSAGGDLAMQAGNDITLTAASAASKEGGITLAAGNDVNLLAASEQHDAVQDMTKKKKGTFSSKTTTTHDEWHDNVAVTTTLSGDTVQIAAGNDLLSQGAQIASTGDVVLAAGNNITLDTVQNTHSEEHEKTVKKSGLYGGGGFSVALGVTKKTDALDVTEVTNSGSLVGSTEGSVTMTAGNKVAITGSDVLSATSTTIVGKEVTIAAAENTVDTVQTSKQQSAGITLGLTGGVVAAAEAAYSATKRGSDVEDDRLKALYAVKAGYAVSDGVAEYQAAAAAGSSMGGVSLRIGIGASSASSKTTTHEETTGGSRILSDGNVTIAATGGDLNVIGSKINGANVALSAANDLNLLSNLESNTNKSENKNAGGEIGVSVGTTTGVYLTAYAGKGSAKGNSDVHAESVVTANDRLTLISGNDTTIKGAQAIGDKVLADVGGDLLIQSEQDTSDYKSKQQQAGMTLVWGFSGSSANYSQQKVNNSYTSVNEQSGIQAGNGGFDIKVGADTKLIGGTIASKGDEALNRLSTNGLVVENIDNISRGGASGLALSADSEILSGSKYAAAKGIVSNMLGDGSAKENHSSSTHSSVAAGFIDVRDGDYSGLHALDMSSLGLSDVGLEKVDTADLQERVEFKQQAKNLVYDQAVKYTDEAYKTMFLKEAKVYVVEKDENGKLLDPRELSVDEKYNLEPSADGMVHIADNGINNVLSGANKYANQHSSADGPQYFVHFPKASDAFSEILIAGYQKYMESDFLGLANATEVTRGYMLQYGQEGLVLDAHSRGSLTVGNAMESLDNLPGSSGLLRETKINFIGPAYNAGAADHLLGYLQNRDSLPNPQDAVITLQNHSNDFVGIFSGLNPVTGGVTPQGGNSLWELLRVMGGKNTPHNCYGAAPAECSPLWVGSPENRSVPIPINKVPTTSIDNFIQKIEILRGSLK
ncbi:hemagglutinin repeat-containing protein [Xanthomonas sp. 3075]|uniref:hemagglutinin repeat-containing protein n=1 Tax=Xanthomonas sp. 3075 TaxID=3035315 RepID=UPI001812BD52|nr:hemagglutinin repeat-containing protein [Xanthomonas sp. 3075]MBB4132598.1 filamentous hemagglutinin [Xanthomonas sp. 3075]